MVKKLVPSSGPSASVSVSPVAASGIPSTLQDDGPLPALFVFDLDYTLWPLWVDAHVTPPLKPTSKPNLVTDRLNQSWHFYPEVPKILHTLKTLSISIAAASRTHTPQLAREMLSLLVLEHAPPPSVAAAAADDETTITTTMRGIDYFDNLEIYPGSKTTHFQKLGEKTGIEYADMIFFDDESRNRDVERKLGVLMVLVPDGVNVEVFDKGVREWRKRRGKKSVEDEDEDDQDEYEYD